MVIRNELSVSNKSWMIAWSHSRSLLGFFEEGGFFCTRVSPKVKRLCYGSTFKAGSHQISARRRHSNHAAQRGCLPLAILDRYGRTLCQRRCSWASE